MGVRRKSVLLLISVVLIILFSSFTTSFPCQNLGGRCFSLSTCQEIELYYDYTDCHLMPEGECDQTIKQNSLFAPLAETCFAVCGDRRIADDYEECDTGSVSGGGPRFQNGDSCEARGYLGGELSCTELCEVDTIECIISPTCETLGGTCWSKNEYIQECVDLLGGPITRAVPLEGTCGVTMFNKLIEERTENDLLYLIDPNMICCAACGDGRIADGDPPAVPAVEECDTYGSVFLPGDSCEARGYLGGELSCDDQCEVDTGTCIWPGHCQDDNGGTCFDTIANCFELEQDPHNYPRSVPLQGLCDLTMQLPIESNLNQQPYAQSNGRICCAACGDGRIAKNIIGYDNEVCDTGEHAFPSWPKLDGKTCQDFGFDGGNLSCGYDCTSFDTSECWNYKYTYLWIPVSYWNDQDEFVLKATPMMDFFMDVNPLRDCKERIENIFVDVNWVNNNCDLSIVPQKQKKLLSRIRKCGNKYVKQYHIENYEKGIGVSQSGVYPEAGFTTQGNKVVFTEIQASGKDTLSNAAHELGHTYYLCDEYLYDYYLREGGSTCGNPWLETYTDDDPPINPCPLNIFPWQHDGSCTGEPGYCCGAYVDIIYSGPYSAEGTVCNATKYSIMGLSFTRSLCGLNTAAYNAIEEYITCEEGLQAYQTLDYLGRMILSFNSTGVEEVTLNSVYVIDGIPSVESQQTTNYTLNITDQNNTVLNSIYLPVYYLLLATSNNISNESLSDLDSIEVSVELPYTPDWKWLRIYKNNELLFETDIQELLCNNNSVCDNYENYYSCPQDCSQSGADDMCNKDVNSECDPDCAKGVDYDCGPSLYDIVNVTAGETKTVKITARAFDPNDENLIYFIDDPRFEQRYNRYFYWQTEIGDAGTYYFTVTVTDGYLTDEQEVEVIVKPYYEGTGSPIYRKPNIKKE